MDRVLDRHRNGERVSVNADFSNSTELKELSGHSMIDTWQKETVIFKRTTSSKSITKPSHFLKINSKDCKFDNLSLK